MKTNPSRRDMLRLAGVGLALPLIPTHQAYSQDNSPRRKGDPDKLSLGLASYSLREFNLEQTLVMAQRVALKKICLKSMHLPLDSSPEQIRAVAAQVQQAGLDLYGAGVVTMKKKSQVDQAFEYATGKDTKEDTTIYLEHNRPLVFGKERNKGIRLNGMDPEIVPLDGDVTEDDLMFHDERQVEPSLAYLLSRMHYPDFPEPMGVFRAVERPTFEDMLMDQVSAAIKERGKGTLEDLYTTGDTWVVE